jgi:hypothetical protein
MPSQQPAVNGRGVERESAVHVPVVHLHGLDRSRLRRPGEGGSSDYDDRVENRAASRHHR